MSLPLVGAVGAALMRVVPLVRSALSSSAGRAAVTRLSSAGQKVARFFGSAETRGERLVKKVAVTSAVTGLIYAEAETDGGVSGVIKKLPGGEAGLAVGAKIVDAKSAPQAVRAESSVKIAMSAAEKAGHISEEDSHYNKYDNIAKAMYYQLIEPDALKAGQSLLGTGVTATTVTDVILQTQEEAKGQDLTQEQVIALAMGNMKKELERDSLAASPVVEAPAATTFAAQAAEQTPEGVLDVHTGGVSVEDTYTRLFNKAVDDSAIGFVYKAVVAVASWFGDAFKRSAQDWALASLGIKDQFNEAVKMAESQALYASQDYKAEPLLGFTNEIS